MKRQPPPGSMPAAMTFAVPREGGVLVGRTGGMVDVTIDHPTVSLRHAKIFRRGARTYVTDLQSSAGTFVDGRRVLSETELPSGARLAIGTFQFVYDGTRLIRARNRHDQLALACVGVTRTVRDHRNADSLVLLDHVSLAFQTGELACLIGPSGSGKSTLLSLLSGRQQPDGGRVLMRGRELQPEFESLKHDIAVVPQRESLHQPLTVQQSLLYSAALRLPSDTSRVELDAIVTELLRDTGLHGLGDVRIRDLSGGQLRRVSLASEIAHRPSVVLLDEVTSGLDEQGDLEIMTLARRLADRGRTVVCITHNTLNIERTAHRVVTLASGGRIACVGTPEETRRYFGVPRLGDVYTALASRPANEWQAAFTRDDLWRRHVGAWLPADDVATNDRRDAACPPAQHSHNFLHQWRVLTGRLMRIQAMDPRPATMAIVQAIFISLLLAAFFGDLTQGDDVALLLVSRRQAAFLLVVSVFWLGCNNAAPEIAKERTLFDRERAVSLSIASYYCSKLLVLGAIAIVQAIVAFTVLSCLSGLPGSQGAQGALVRTTAVAGTAVLGTMAGLALSAMAKSEQIAIRAVPMLMIPQIVLANVLTPLRGWLESVAPLVTTTYWTFRGFTSGSPEYGTDEPVAAIWNLTLPALSAHAAAYIAVAVWRLRAR
jgi:ABC-type multidrug transport system ATPase subunit